MVTRQKIALCVLIVMLAVVGGPAAEGAGGAAKLKVHKKQITVLPPNEAGVVVVRGLAGAIEYAGETELEIVVEKSSKAKMNKDGSFAEELTAEAGDRIVITVRNEAGKKSRGMFKVPAREITEVAATEEKRPADVAVAEKEEQADENGGLLVIIQVVDKSTMEILTEKRISIPIDKIADAPRRAEQLARETARRCISFVKRFSKRASKRTVDEKKVEEKKVEEQK